MGYNVPWGDKVSPVARMLRDRNHYLDTVPVDLLDNTHTVTFNMKN